MQLTRAHSCCVSQVDAVLSPSKGAVDSELRKLLDVQYKCLVSSIKKYKYCSSRTVFIEWLCCHCVPSCCLGVGELKAVEGNNLALSKRQRMSDKYCILPSYALFHSNNTNYIMINTIIAPS